MNTKKVNCSKIVAIIAGIFFSGVAIGHNRVVVIPLLEDAPPRAYAPIKTDEAPRADYFIHAETVRDLVTGLEWQRNEDAFSHDWQGAINYCRQLELRGFDDWRLPTINELIGITDYTRLSPALSVQAFPDPKSALDYWSSTIDPQGDLFRRVLDVSTGAVILGGTSGQRYVRCVRAGNSNGSTFVDNNDGSVQDLSFGLMWEKATFSGTVSDLAQNFSSLHDAQAYCNELGLGGFRNWRLPSLKELVSLLDFRVSLKMNRVFSYTILALDQSLYTSTTFAGGTPPDGVWVVRFSGRDSLTNMVDIVPLESNTESSVKCVRNMN